MHVGRQLTLKASKPCTDIQCNVTMGAWLQHAAQGQSRPPLQPLLQPLSQLPHLQERPILPNITAVWTELAAKLVARAEVGNHAMDARSLVKIVHDPAKGRVLIAAGDLLAGQAIVREQPLLVDKSNHYSGCQV